MEKLDELIDLVKSIEKIEWIGGDVIGRTEDGKEIRQWPYPIYPDGLYEALYGLLELDKDYIENYRKLSVPFDYDSMTIDELRTVITHLVRGERFCEGLIAEAVENGTLLKILMRIREAYPDL